MKENILKLNSRLKNITDIFSYEILKTEITIKI